MRVIFAKKMGFCSGVRRAVSLAQNTCKIKNQKPKTKYQKETNAHPVYTLGPLIHNPQEVERLESLGIKAISSLNQIEVGTLIVPSHGLPQSILKKTEKMRLKLIDATCPFVKRAQLLAENLHNRGYQVIIVGQKTHPEVISLLSFTDGKASVVGTPQDLKKVEISEKIGLISQTTQSRENFKEIVRRLKPKIKSKSGELKIYNTICKETSQRQKEAKRLAEKSDVMIVIGGKNSANTTRLYNICKKVTRAYHVESPEELRPDWFSKREVVGVTAGTSTPDWVIRDVIKKLRRNKPR
jgi:4-hydroxy-3-methylbut-2-enyl diphosphate reductase